jgi:hypothetical protein
LTGGDVYLEFSSSDNQFQENNKISEEKNKIEINPTIGYKINKFDFGINPIFQYHYNKVNRTSDLTDSNANSYTNFGIGIELFTRYTFITIERFSILGRLGTNYSYRSGEYSNHSISVNISPVFEYKLIDRLLLYTNFGIRGISYVYNFEEMNNETHSQSSFAFRLINSYLLGNIVFGFYIII